MEHRRIKATLAAALCLLALLSGCSPRDDSTSARLYSTQDVQTLLESGAFSGAMEEVDSDMIALLYGLDEASVEEGVCYMALNTSVSADEVTVLVLTDEDAAQAAQEACQQRLADQLRVCQTYAPAAVPALEGAVVDRVGNTVLLAVGDPDTLPQAVAQLHG